MRKLKELTLHISDVCQDDPEFGATKLNKILFVSDFFAYSVFGKSITGENYFHLPKGPAPKKMKRIQAELIVEGRAEIVDRPYFGRTQKRLVPKKGANTTLFEQEELDLVKDVVNSMRGITAKEISDWIHQLLPWLLTEDREDIPYHTTFAMFHVPTSRPGLIWGLNRLMQLKESGHAT